MKQLYFFSISHLKVSSSTYFLFSLWFLYSCRFLSQCSTLTSHRFWKPYHADNMVKGEADNITYSQPFTGHRTWQQPIALTCGCSCSYEEIQSKCKLRKFHEPGVAKYPWVIHSPEQHHTALHLCCFLSDMFLLLMRNNSTVRHLCLHWLLLGAVSTWGPSQFYPRVTSELKATFPPSPALSGSCRSRPIRYSVFEAWNNFFSLFWLCL